MEIEERNGINYIKPKAGVAKKSIVDVVKELGIDVNDIKLSEDLDTETFTTPFLSEKMEEVVESTHINDTVFELLDITKDMLLAEMESFLKLSETPYLTKTDVERVFDRISDILNK